MTPDIWIIAEQRNGQLQSVSFELLTRGIALAWKRQAQLSAVIFGSGIPDAELQKLIDCGADRVLAVDAPELAEFDFESQAAALGIDRRLG